MYRHSLPPERLQWAGLLAAPPEWEVLPLGRLCSSQYGLSVSATDDGNIAMVGMQQVRHGTVVLSGAKRVKLDDVAQQNYRLRPRDLLFNRTNSFDQVGKTGIVGEFGTEPVVFASYLIRLAAKADADAQFLNHYMNCPGVVQRIKSLATPGVSQFNINPSALLKRLLVPVPPLWEQRAIARVLGIWDRAIDQGERLLKLKRRQKRGLTQQLLNGRRRFSEFDGQPWREARLRDVAESTCTRNRGALGRDSVKAVTKASGMVPMRPELIAGSIERYQIVHPDAFAYNPMRLNIGSIARWRGSHDVLVSPDYVVFRCKSDQLDPAYLDQFRRSHTWSSFMSACGNGSVRVRIWFDDLGVMKLKLPPLAEQRKIAAVLATADREIDLLEQQLAALREQKKGLMQKLLTGRVRVTGDSCNVQER